MAIPCHGQFLDARVDGGSIVEEIEEEVFEVGDGDGDVSEEDGGELGAELVGGEGEGEEGVVFFRVDVVVWE